MAELWITTMQAVVGALIDRACSAVLGMTLTKCEEGPGKTLFGQHRLEYEAERRGGSAFLAERHVDPSRTPEAGCYLGRASRTGSRGVSVFRFRVPDGQFPP